MSGSTRLAEGLPVIHPTLVLRSGGLTCSNPLYKTGERFRCQNSALHSDADLLMKYTKWEINSFNTTTEKVVFAGLRMKANKEIF